MSSSTSSQVAAAIWPWRQAQPGHPADRPVRRRHAAAEAAVMCAVAALLTFVLRKPVIGGVVLALALLVFLGGFFFPPLYRGFKKAGTWLGKAVGTTFAWVLLAPFFYLCFTAGHAYLALRGKDPLQRAFRTAERSYWIPRRPVPGPAHYRRQY